MLLGCNSEILHNWIPPLLWLDFRQDQGPRFRQDFSFWQIISSFSQLWRSSSLGMGAAAVYGVDEIWFGTMEFVAQKGKQLHDECSTLVLPALSIGNVGQLAVDLLIATTKAERIGYIDDPNIVPCVGNDAYGPVSAGELTLPLEVFDSVLSLLSLIQQRSPINKGKITEFAKNIAHFADFNKKTHVVLLSSLDFRRLKNLDRHSSGQIYYISSRNIDGTDEECEKQGWTRLQEYDHTQRSWKRLSHLADETSLREPEPYFEDDVEDEDYYPSLPFAALFYCLKAKGLRVTCLFCYCSEGDNRKDAFHLADVVCKLLRIKPWNPQGSEKWCIPLSWNSVYGPPPDNSIF